MRPRPVDVLDPVHVWHGLDGRWRYWQLTTAERREVVRRLSGEGVGPRDIARRLGGTGRRACRIERAVFRDLAWWRKWL